MYKFDDILQWRCAYPLIALVGSFVEDHNYCIDDNDGHEPYLRHLFFSIHNYFFFAQLSMRPTNNTTVA